MALFGRKAPEKPAIALDQLPAELKALIQKAQEERTKFSQLVGRAKQVSDKLGTFEEPLTQLQRKADNAAQRLARVEEKAADLDAVAKRIEQVALRLGTTEQQAAGTQDALKQVTGDIA